MLNQAVKIAIVVSRFNAEITEELLQGALAKLIDLGVTQENITTIHVPGAIEIPLTAKLIASKKHCHAIISLGCVIRGETDHYNYVCQQVSLGCQQVMLEFNIPVIFGVLTTNNFEQAKERVSQMHHKGIEAAEAAIEMIEIVSSLTTIKL